jgi:NADPH2:quinone reductase
VPQAPTTCSARTAPWKDEARELGGVDVVLDPVGGDRFTDSLRSLKPGGRLLVVGFTEGSIPEVRVNRLLLANTEVVGAGWGSYVLSGWGSDNAARLDYLRETARTLDDLIASGHVAPIVGASFGLERAADALKLIESRAATGKIVLDIT